ncbi:ATP-binding protein [Pokkaliibacter sp. CJK22405]|uniref:ATP-binding protein n=1 Tax=Pokkaliibacter sp. CJK22405 TaxID=3384615 RepID=UPI003984DAC7
MSLRRLLLIVVLGLVAVGQIVSFLWILEQGEYELEEVLDNDLLSQAGWTSLWLKNLPVEDTEKIAKELTEHPLDAMPIKLSKHERHHLTNSRLQLWDPKTNHWWPEQLPQKPILEPGFGRLDYNEVHWRTFDLVLEGVPLRARLWQALDVRDVAIEETLEAMLLPNLAVLLVLLLVLGYVIHRGLKPLGTLSQRLQLRTASDLSLLPEVSSRAELKQLTQSLNGWIGRLDETLQRERGFAADVAHELRSPLAALMLQLSEIEHQTAEVQQARASVSRLARVVDQLLSLARLENRLATLDLQPVDLQPMLEELLGELFDSPLANGKDVSLIGEAPAVMSEPILVRVLLRNLLENALKYSGEGGQVEVELLSDETEVTMPNEAVDVEDDIVLARRVICRVRDNGPGISAERRSEVMKRFVRLDTGREGAGLGLAIVSRIATALDIRWQLQDRDDQQPGLQVELCWQPTGVVKESKVSGESSAHV